MAVLDLREVAESLAAEGDGVAGVERDAEVRQAAGGAHVPDLVEAVGELLHRARGEGAHRRGRHPRGEAARAVVEGERVERSALVAEAVLERGLRVGAERELRLGAEGLGVAVRVEREQAARERAGQLRRVALLHGEVLEQAGGEQIERDRVAVRVGARERDPVHRRRGVAAGEPAHHHRAIREHRHRGHALHRVGGGGVRAAGELLRREHVGDGVRALALEGEPRLGAGVDLRDDRLLLAELGLDRSELQIADGVSALDHGEALHVDALVELVPDAEVVLPGREREGEVPLEVRGRRDRAVDAGGDLDHALDQRLTGLRVGDGAGDAGERGLRFARGRRGRGLGVRGSGEERGGERDSQLHGGRRCTGHP